MNRPDFDELRRRTGVAGHHRARAVEEPAEASAWRAWAGGALLGVGLPARLALAGWAGGVGGVGLATAELVLAVVAAGGGVWLAGQVFEDEAGPPAELGLAVGGLTAASAAAGGGVLWLLHGAEEAGGYLPALYASVLLWLVGSLVLLRGDRLAALAQGVAGAAGSLAVSLLLAQTASGDSGLLFAH